MTRVPGIGRTFARAIVEHFGAEHVFKELDRDPERLREVRTKAGRAISRKSVERAIVAWREVATIREVETFLFTHGISAGLAARLVRQYGDDRRRAAHAGPVPPHRAAAHRLQDRRPHRALARHRAR